VQEAAGENETAWETWVEARLLYAEAGVDAGVAEAERRLAGLAVD